MTRVHDEQKLPCWVRQRLDEARLCRKIAEEDCQQAEERCRELERLAYPNLPVPEAVSPAEVWHVGEPRGPSGPFYSIVSSTGRVIALQIPCRRLAERIARLPMLEARR